MGKQERPNRGAALIDPQPWFCARKIVALTEGQRERALTVVGTGDIPIGIDLMDPDSGHEEVAALVRATMQRPLMGKPRRPSALYVTDPALVGPLQRALGKSVEVEARELPIVEPLFEALIETLRGRDAQADGSDEDDYEDPSFTFASLEGVTASDLVRFYEAAAHLVRAAPWDTLLDSDVMRVRFEGQLDRSVCLSMTRGDEGIRAGFLVFRSLVDFGHFRRKDPDAEPVETLALELVRPDRFAALAAEANANGWPGEDGDNAVVPYLVRFTADGDESDPTRDDLILATEICAIVASAVEEGELAIRADWPFEHSRSLVTEASGEAHLRAPYPREFLPGTRPEKAAATTRDAVLRVANLWAKDVERTRSRDLDDAADDIAVLDPEGDPDHQDDMANVWTSFWRPVTEGKNPIDILRKRTFAKAPVARAAVERIAAARGAFVEVLDIEPGQAILVRDLATDARYRVLHPDSKRIARWRRGFGVFVDLDGTSWWPATTLDFFDGAETVDYETLVNEFRRCLTSLGVDRSEGEFPLDAPHAAFARWAGVAYAALSRLCPDEEEGEDLDLGIDDVKVHVEAPEHGEKRRSVREIRELLDEDVPELEGVPRKLAKHQATRDKVEQWLRDAERRGYAEGFLDLDPIRKELGLDTTR